MQSMGVHKTFHPFYINEKCSVTVTATKLRFVGAAMLLFHSLLFTQYKTTWLTVKQSQSGCITCQVVCAQQSHAAQRLLP